MPTTQTTGVQIVIRAQAVMARQEIKLLRKDVSEFATFTREQFRGIGGGIVRAPKLDPEWRKLETEIVTITKSIKKSIDSISSLKMRAPSVGTFLKTGQNNADVAQLKAELAKVKADAQQAVKDAQRQVGVSPSARAGKAGGNISRAQETEEASRLTREYKAGLLSLEQYRQKLDQVSKAAVVGSEKQIDALARVRAAERALAADEKKVADAAKLKPVSRAKEIEDISRLDREYHAGIVSAKAYKESLNEIAKTAQQGSERQIEALTRVREAEAAEAAAAKRAAAEKKEADAKRMERFNTGAQVTQNVGDALTAAVTLPAAGAFAAAVKTTTEYEAALRNVNTEAQLSEAEFKKLYDSVILIAKDPNVTAGPTELAKALFNIQGAGFTGEKGLEVLHVAALGATAGLTDTTKSSEALIAVLKSGIGGFNGTREAMDILLQGVNLGKIRFEELTAQVGKVLPVATSAGVGLKDLVAGIATLTAQGQPASRATTDFLNVINKLAVPVGQARKAFIEQGVSFGTTAIQVKGLNGVLDELYKKTGANLEKVHAFIPDMRAARGAIALMKGDVADYNKNLAAMDQATSGMGQTQRAANEQNKSFANELKDLRKDFEVMAVQVGPAFIAALRDILKAVRPLIDDTAQLAEAFSKLSPEQQRATLTLFAFAAAVGPVLSGLGRLGQGVTEAIRVYRILIPEAKAAGAAVAESDAVMAEAGTAAAATTAQVNGLSTAMSMLGKVGKIGLVVTLALVGAEALTSLINQLDKLAGGGLADQFANLAKSMGADAATVERIRKNGVPTLTDTIGEGGKMFGDFSKANSDASNAENNPMNQAIQREQTARADQQAAAQRAAQFSAIDKRGYSTNDFHTIRDEYTRRGLDPDKEIPRDLSGNLDYTQAASNLSGMNSKDASDAAAQVAAAQREQFGVRAASRRDFATQQLGYSLGGLTPARGVNLGGLDSRTNNVMRSISKANAQGQILSVTKDAQGRQIITIAGNGAPDIDRVQSGLVDYGIHRAQAGETTKSVTDSISAQVQGNNITITVVPDGSRAANARKKTGGVIQPDGAGDDKDKGGSKGDRSPVVSNVPAINAETAKAGLESQYGVAYGQYGEKGALMSTGQRQTALNGLMSLANQIEQADKTIAKAKLDEAEQAVKEDRAQANETLGDSKAKDGEKESARHKLEEANKKDGEAQATYAGEMRKIQADHSEKFRQLYTEAERIQKDANEEAARATNQAAEQEAKRHEEHAADIEEQLKYEKDTAKRAKLLADKYAELQAAADARFKGTLATANATGTGPNDPARILAVNAANSEHTFQTQDITREARGAGVENTIQGMQQDIETMRKAAEAVDDLVQRNIALNKVREAEIALMKREGATEAQLAAARAENLKQSNAEQAAIAHNHAESLLVQASVNGVGSLAPAGSRGSKAEIDAAGARELAKQLNGYFQEEYAKTEPSGRGRVADDQLSLLSHAVAEGMTTVQDILPLLKDLETRVTASGSLDSTSAFYKAIADLFSKQLEQTFREFDRKNGPSRENAYNSLAAGIQSGSQFAGLSDQEKSIVVKVVTDKKNQRDDSGAKFNSGVEKDIDSFEQSITASADQASGEWIGALFGQHGQGKAKAKAATEQFWKSVESSGEHTLAQLINTILLKPVGDAITGSLKKSFSDGASQWASTLKGAQGNFGQVFKEGALEIAQAAIYLNGVLALAGKQGGGRGKKGGMLGAAAGIGVGLLTGGTGLALVGAPYPARLPADRSRMVTTWARRRQFWAVLPGADRSEQGRSAQKRRPGLSRLGSVYLWRSAAARRAASCTK